MTALELPMAYYDTPPRRLPGARGPLAGPLDKAGFKTFEPRGAYYILTECAHFLERYGLPDDTAFAMYLIKEVGVAGAGSSFYAHPELGRTKIRASPRPTTCSSRRVSASSASARPVARLLCPAAPCRWAQPAATCVADLAELRRAARRILDAAIEAGDAPPDAAGARPGRSTPPRRGRVFDLDRLRRVVVVGAGKASGTMAAAVESLLDESPSRSWWR